MLTAQETKIHYKPRLCILCEEEVKEQLIQDGEMLFCCHGCLAVYRILESQSQLKEKENHPLIKQAVEFGLISNPNLLEKIRLKEQKLPEFSQKWILEIGGMWCPSCAELIHLALGQQKGVIRCQVDYITDMASIEWDPRLVSKEKIQQWISQLGYRTQELQESSSHSVSFWLIMRFAVAAFCGLNVMMFSYPLYATYFDFDLEGLQPLLAWISFSLTLPVVLFSAYPIFKRLWPQLKHGYLAMESLVGMGIIAAMGLSLWEMMNNSYFVYFDTVTVLITFLLLGKIIEAKAKFSSKSALFHLNRSLPRKGRKKCDNGATVFVPIKEIKPSDHLIAFTGERIVLDGEVYSGEGSCDESILTGEAKPVWKQKGDRLISGTIVKNGTLQYTVTAIEKESTLHRILSMIEQDIGHKSVYVRSIDDLIRWVAPLVLAISIGVFMGGLLWQLEYQEALQRALAVLLIACPCAIGIAAPLVEARLTHRFANKGALVRNRSLFSLFPKITHIVFDKTGTLTEGRFQVLSGLDKDHEGELKALSSHSTHPVSQAIAEASAATPTEFSCIQEIAGRGIKGISGNQWFFLGSYQFAKEHGLSLPSPDDRYTYAYFFITNRLIATIALGDKLRSEAKEAINRLEGIKKSLVSGDQPKAVSLVAKELSFDAWKAEASPLEKQAYIGQLKKEGEIVAMVGDGINDAPALTKADVAISVVSATDLSIQVSDLLLTSDKLTLLAELHALACKGSRLVRQNLFWAFSYNIIGIGLAAAGALTPLFASFAMIMSSLIVLLNAKRI